MSGNEGLNQEVFDRIKRILNALYETSHKVNVSEIVRENRKARGKDSAMPMVGDDIDPKEVRLLAQIQHEK